MNGQLRIDECFAFTMIDEDGTEGVPGFLGPDKVFFPLMGADIARVDSLRPMAQSIADETGKPITLLKFSQREVLEVITPADTGGESGG